MALIAFVGFIVILATILMSKNVDLVSEDYYQKEITYEDQIQAKKNANRLAETVKISQNDKFVIVSVPEGPFTDVELSLDRPNNDAKDMLFPIEGTKTFLIDKTKLDRGMYNAKITFSHEDKPCQEETSIYVEK